MVNLIEKQLEEADRICQQAGAQLTDIRKTVLTLIYNQRKYITAYELLDLLRQSNPKAQSMTIYRALDFLQKRQLIHRIDSKKAYIACSMLHKEHQAQLLICELCSKIQEINASSLKRITKALSASHHFLVAEKPIELLGTCGKCKKIDD